MNTKRSKLLNVFIVLLFVTSASINASMLNQSMPNAANGKSSSSSITSTSSTGSTSSASSSNSQQFSTVPTYLPRSLDKALLLGPLSPSHQLSIQLVLSLRNRAGLKSLLSQLYDPSSPLYRHRMQPSQFFALYGPDPAEVAALTRYMQSKGLQVHHRANNPLMVELTGTVSQMQDALKTEIDSFSLNGKTFYSAASQAQLPSRFSDVQMIYGLENFDSQLEGTGAVPMYRTLGTVTPGQTPNNFMYYSPSEIADMYNASQLLQSYSGDGYSIAIVDAYGDPYIEQELVDFCTQFELYYGEGTLNIIPVPDEESYNPENGITTGWNTEVALDVEWAHAMAPGAVINLYVAADNGAYLYEAVMDAVLGYDGESYFSLPNSIISLSWGAPENDFASSVPTDPMWGYNYPWLDQVFQYAAACGETVFASTGDWGAYDQSFPQTSPYGGAIYPSTDPYVTAVGGTALYMNATQGYYQFPYANATGPTPYGNETAWSWNNYYNWATGGGWSTFFGQPSWQDAPGVVGNGARGVPDVAWDADVQTGVLVSVYNPGTDSYDYWIIGGTSVGSPCWAGSMALIDEAIDEGWWGCINPTIYSICGDDAAYSKAFHDITIGNNNPDSATEGWDSLTGVGSPNLGELASYIAGSDIWVPVYNNFSVLYDDTGNPYYFNARFAYGQVVNITANIGGEGITSVTADIASSTGVTIASGITLTYNDRIGVYTGTYAIQPTDPSGEWTATVTVAFESYSRHGYTTFLVGDGVTIYNPPSYTGQYYQVGDTVSVASYVVDPSDSDVTEGDYTAIFYLAQNQATGEGLGSVEGKITLEYNSGSGYWEGNFVVPSGVDQGAWIIVVNGTDLNGNMGSAYTWINVGLDICVFIGPTDFLLLSPLTDYPTYILGENISILAYPSYVDESEAQTGTFTATIYDGPTLVATVPMTYTHDTGVGSIAGNTMLGVQFDMMGLWKGTYETSEDDPTGFYTITVNGTDGMGNSGSFATVVRVAEYGLNVDASVSDPVVPLTNGLESSVLAKITYPDDAPMTIGNVIGFLYQDYGGGITDLVHTFRMTYNATAGGFVAFDLLSTVDWSESLIGNYTIDVEAYDPLGNYGSATASFFVAGEDHAPIQISSDDDFTPENGVVAGTGSSGEDPYIIAGWDVPSISITNVTKCYQLYNLYVSGSTGNGITIYTPSSRPYLQWVYTIGNTGHGLYINGSDSPVCMQVIAGNNGKDGILIANDTDGENSYLGGCLAYNNAFNGIVYESSLYAGFYYNYAIGNTLVGILSQDSVNPYLWGNVAVGNSVGIKVTAQPGSWYGTADIELNDVEQNGIGIYIDGLGQDLATAEYYGEPSKAVVYDNLVLQNDVGIYAANQAMIDAESDSSYQMIAENGIGISAVDSSAYVGYNYVVLNLYDGIQIVGRSAFNWTDLPFTTAVFLNEVMWNGEFYPASGSGISISNTNCSFIAYNEVYYNGGNGIELNDVRGFTFVIPGGPTISSVALGMNQVAYNEVNGIGAYNATRVLFGANTGMGNMQCGIEVNGGSGNHFTANTWIGNAQSGMLLCGGTNHNNITVDSNFEGYPEQASLNRYGFEIADSSWNTLNCVSAVANVVGLLLCPPATHNVILNESGFLYNDIGVKFDNSHYNTVYNCSIEFNTMYGFCFVNAAYNEYWGNILLGNGVDIFPEPPATIADLAVVSSTETSITLTWTASGDNGTLGTAAGYWVRYSTTGPITASNWASATNYTQYWAPLLAGYAEVRVVLELENATRYWFAVLACGSAGTRGEVSNSPPGLTVDAFAPATITDLATTSPTATSITLTWTAPGDNGTLGTAAYYVVKYSTAGPITASNWASATPYPQSWTPLPAWSTETHEVSDLNNATRYWFAVEAYDLASNHGGVSNSPSGLTLDAYSPATITDLAASNPTADSITLTWTAPGDNGTLGTAAYYVVKYSTAGPITSLTWASATTYSQTWVPLAAGQTETQIVSGLSNATTYWFAVEAYDLAGNYGGVSNSPSGLTLDAYSPATITDLAASNPTATSITLTWTAPGDNGTLGTAAYYVVKYSTAGPITASNWASATNYTQYWTPLLAGSTESHVVTGLYSNRTYWFAVVAYDAADNYAGVSNSPSGRTMSISLVTPPGFFGQNGFGISTNGSSVVVTNFAAQPSGTGAPPSGLTSFVYLEMTGSLVPGSHTAVIELYYNRTRVQQLGLDESTLSLYTWNTTTSQWQAIPSTVTALNATTGLVTAYVSHFSYFAIFGAAPSTGGGAVLGIQTIIIIGGAVAALAVILVAIMLVKRKGKPTKIR